MRVLYLTVLENTEKNYIHENQILSLNSSDIEYKFLFISPLFILNRTHCKVNRNKFLKKNNCCEVKIPILSFHFFLHIVLIPYVLLWAIPILIYQVVKYKPQILHCRNLISIFVAVILRKFFCFKFSIVADPRSVYPEEGVIIKRWKYNQFNYKVWKKIEKWSFKYSDVCLGLSPYFADYLSRYNKNSLYIPAVVAESKKYNDDDRIFIRNKYEVKENELVVIYVGSIGLWHDIDMLIEIVEKVSIANQGNIKVIALSGSTELKLKLLSHFKDKCLYCGSVPPQEVERYLLMADFGILPGSVNYNEEYDLLYKTMIASKAEEYLCAGLPIIVNDRIINLKTYVEEYRWGEVYNVDTHNLEKSQIQVYSTENRKRISKEAINIFGLENVKKQLFRVYQQLLK